MDHTLEADVARMTAFKHVEQFALKHFQINELPVEARSLLIRSLEKETYPSGTDFIKQGDRGEKLYVLVEGSVEFVKDDVAVSTGHAPTLLGDLSIIYGTLRSISVRVRGARSRRARSTQAFADVSMTYLRAGGLRSECFLLPAPRCSAQRYRDHQHPGCIFDSHFDWRYFPGKYAAER